MRGKRNESAFLVYVVQKMADVYGISIEEIARQTTENAQRVFGQLTIENWSSTMIGSLSWSLHSLPCQGLVLFYWAIMLFIVKD